MFSDTATLPPSNLGPPSREPPAARTASPSGKFVLRASFPGGRMAHPWSVAVLVEKADRVGRSHDALAALARAKGHNIAAAGVKITLEMSP